MRRKIKPPPASPNGLAWGFASLAPQRSERKETMKQFLLDILRQITGRRLQKSKLIITYWANVQKMDLGLDMNTIEEVFETGRESKSKAMEVIQFQFPTNGMRIISTTLLPA